MRNIKSKVSSPVGRISAMQLAPPYSRIWISPRIFVLKTSMIENIVLDHYHERYQDWQALVAQRQRRPV